MEVGELPCVDPFSLFMYNFSPEQKLMIAQRFAQHAKDNTLKVLKASGIDYKPFQFQLVHNIDMVKIRIGYMSYDFADHPLAHLMASIFKMHDRSRF
jgi:protein O-GlcNAc transferase